MFLNLNIDLIYFDFNGSQSSARILSDDNSKCDPPDTISNSEVKPLSADGSVVFSMRE